MEKAEKIVISIAILLLAIGFLSNAFISREELKDYIEINGIKIAAEKIFSSCEKKELKIGNETYFGISLPCLINMAGIKNPEEHNYKIMASDYQKTVSWNDISSGILTEEKRAIFPNLPKAFWVRNVIKIEVI